MCSSDVARCRREGDLPGRYRDRNGSSEAVGSADGGLARHIFHEQIQPVPPLSMGTVHRRNHVPQDFEEPWLHLDAAVSVTLARVMQVETLARHPTVRRQPTGPGKSNAVLAPSRPVGRTLTGRLSRWNSLNRP